MKSKNADDSTNINPTIHKENPIAKESPKLCVLLKILGTIVPFKKEPHRGMQDNIEIANGSSKFINQVEMIEACPTYMDSHPTPKKNLPTSIS